MSGWIDRYERVWMGVLLVTFAVMAFGFSTSPIFEGSDEIEHYRYIRTVTQTNALPHPYEGERVQSHQAPLYYLTLALLARWLPDGDFDEIDGRTNPFFGHLVLESGTDNKNRYLHTQAELFPTLTSETARKVHLLRLTSVLMGTLSVGLAMVTVKRVVPDGITRLLAYAVLALTPQFAYSAGNINNDHLAILLATSILFVLVQVIQEGWSRRLALWLGLLVGLSLLNKQHSAVIGLPVLVTLLLQRNGWRYVPFMGLLVMGIAGWWYIGNWVNYRDPLLSSAVLTTWQGENYGFFNWQEGIQRAPYAYQTLWARFYAGAIPVHPFMLAVYDGLVLLGIAGCVMRLTRQPIYWRMVSLWGAFAGAWILGLLYLSSLMWSGNQGRYLQPAHVIWATLIAIGISTLAGRWRMWSSLGITVVLLVFIQVGFWVYFLPAYRVAPASTPINILNITYGDVAVLEGISPAQIVGRAGELVSVRLHWRALRPADTDLLVALQSINSDLVSRRSYPATGKLLATDWQADMAWTETYWIQLPDDIPAQQALPLMVDLYDPQTLQKIIPFDAEGQPITAVVGRLVVPNNPIPSPDLRAQWSAQIGLASVDARPLSTQTQVCGNFYALDVVEIDYTWMLHLYEADERVAIADTPFSYPTGAWQAGELVTFCVVIPAVGDYVEIGLYDPQTVTRLPLYQANTRLTDDRLVVDVTP